MGPARVIDVGRRLPAYALNGIAVALGVGAVQLLFGALAGLHAAQLVLGGAVSTSLADVPNTPARTRNTVGLAALLSIVAAALVTLLGRFGAGMGVGVAAIAFGSAMLLSWGTRAGAMAFAPVLSLVFSLATPPTSAPWLVVVGGNAAGSLAYFLWALLSSALLRRRYAALALAEAMRAQAQLLRARAALVGPSGPEAMEQALQTWIRDESALAERLQAARDFVFTAPASPQSIRQTALLLQVIDLRDALLASRMDLDLLGKDAAALALRSELADTLHSIAAWLEATAAGVREGAPPHAGWPAVAAFAGLASGARIGADDERARLVPALEGRVRYLHDDVARIHALLVGEAEGPATLPLTREQLQEFVAPEGWPLQALRSQLAWHSPVLRHALRTSLALTLAYHVSRLLPWASHPHWLVLSVAVVLRGSLDQTLMRRNARVLGTVLGCLLVLALSRIAFVPLLDVLFLAAVGMAHAFVSRRYWLTAVAATVMALLQSHLVNPAGGFAVAERLADTVLGAMLAWAFGYVLPAWERRGLAPSIHRVLKALSRYAELALVADSVTSLRQRLARQRAYDALTLLGAVLQRTAAEPRRVRVPVREVGELLDAGQRFMAHLSIARMTLMNRRDEFTGAEAEDTLLQARQALALALDLRRDDLPSVSETLGELPRLPLLAPAQDIKPWMARRLSMLAQDAQLIRRSAQAVLHSLPARTGAVSGADR